MTFSTTSSPRRGAPVGRWVLALGPLALAGEATIRFDSLTTPLVVELVLSIPDPEEAGLRLVLGPGVARVRAAGDG